MASGKIEKSSIFIIAVVFTIVGLGLIHESRKPIPYYSVFLILLVVWSLVLLWCNIRATDRKMQFVFTVIVLSIGVCSFALYGLLQGWTHTPYSVISLEGKEGDQINLYTLSFFTQERLEQIKTGQQSPPYPMKIGGGEVWGGTKIYFEFMLGIAFLTLLYIARVIGYRIDK